MLTPILLAALQVLAPIVVAGFFDIEETPGRPLYIVPVEQTPGGSVSCNDIGSCDDRTQRPHQVCGVMPLDDDDCEKAHCPPRVQIIQFDNACQACSVARVTRYYPRGCP